MGLFIWQNQADETPGFHPFIINYSVTESALLKDGYTYAPVDVPILHKENESISIGYQFDYVCEGGEVEGFDAPTEIIQCRNTEIYTRICNIYIKELDSAQIINLINSYDADILGNLNLKKTLIG